MLEATVNRSHLVRIAIGAALLGLVLWMIPRPSAAAPAGASNFEQRCERDMRPVIVVRTMVPGVVLNHGVSSRVLNTKGAYSNAGEAMLGMTSSSTRAEISVGGPSLTDPASGRECLAPRIDVELTYQPFDIYVAREFHANSCSYRTVFAHEMEHVRIYTDNLPVIEERVREELLRRYDGRPVYAPINQGLGVLHDQIDRWLRPLIKSELVKVELQQRVLDTRDEVERLSHACQGEIATLMGSSF